LNHIQKMILSVIDENMLTSLGNLVSDVLERFYLILDTLARFIMDIEQFEIK